MRDNEEANVVFLKVFNSDNFLLCLCCIYLGVFNVRLKKKIVLFFSEKEYYIGLAYMVTWNFVNSTFYVYLKLCFPNSCLQSSSSLVKLSWFLSVFIFRIRNAMKKNKDDAIAKDDAASESFHPRRFSRWTFTKGRASSNTRTSSSTEM